MDIFKTDLAQLIKDRDYEGIWALIISKLPLIVAVVAILVLGFIISNFIGRLVVKGLRLKGVDPSVHGFIKTIVVWILKCFVILTALSTLGVNVNSFVAALAAGGLTAGIGLQQSINQFASGLQILLNHPFASGDFIDIGSVSGKVKEIRIMYTVLITVDNKKVIVPNSHITDSNIINFTAEEQRRIELKFTVAYTDDIERAKQTTLDTAAGCDKILTEPAPDAAVTEHADSGVVLVCHVWCLSRDYYDVYYYMMENVKLAFDKNNITIPYNKLDVSITGAVKNDKTTD